MCVCVCMTTHIIEECNELNARAKTRLPTATENQSEKVEDVNSIIPCSSILIVFYLVEIES